MVLACVQLGEYRAMIVLSLGLDNCLVGVATVLLIEHKHELQMSMDRSHNSHNRRLLQLERDLVRLVVPQVVDTMALSVVEVLLLAIGPKQVARGVQGGG